MASGKMILAGPKTTRSKRRNYRRKYRGRLYKRGRKTGSIYLTRKLLEMAISNSGTTGGVTLVDPSATCLQVGATALSVGSSQGYDVPFSLRFRLDQIINSSEIQALCDKYKIVGAYLRIYYNKSGSAAGATAGMPYVEYITDHDDANVPTVSFLREKMGVHLKTFANASSYIGMKCIPKPTREIYATGIATAYELPTKPIWIDMGNPSVEHYGIKGVLHNVFLPNGNALTEVFKFDVTLKIVGKDIQ